MSRAGYRLLAIFLIPILLALWAYALDRLRRPTRAVNKLRQGGPATHQPAPGPP